MTKKLRFGTGGVPLTSKGRSTLDGIKRIKELGLQHMELEFVQGVRMGEPMAHDVNKLASDLGISLSVHGPYYVNLAAQDNRIFYGSIKYISDAIYIGGLAGARSVTFHPAFYQKGSPEETYERVEKAIEKIYAEFQKPKFAGHPIQKGEIFLAPELTGKPTQFGDLEELVKLCQKFATQKLRLCFDFAHKFARSNGKFNTYDEFCTMLEYIETNAGRELLEDMHIHVSAIMHSEKGERNHLTMLNSVEEYHDHGIKLAGDQEIMLELNHKNKAGGSKFDWQSLLKALKKMEIGGMVVCESPNLELDALLMQQVYNSI